MTLWSQNLGQGTQGLESTLLVWSHPDGFTAYSGHGGDSEQFQRSALRLFAHRLLDQVPDSGLEEVVTSVADIYDHSMFLAHHRPDEVKRLPSATTLEITGLSLRPTFAIADDE